MNEENKTQEVIIEDAIINETNIKPEKKARNYKPTLFLLLVAVISLSCGFGGSYLSFKIFKPQSVIYQAIEPTNATGVKNDNRLSIEEIVDKTADSVVEIKVTETSTPELFFQTIQEAAGSGVIFTSDGYIVTNNHVIENSDNIQVKTHDGTIYDATLIGSDSKTDIAVIKIEAEGLNPAILGDSKTLKVGELAVAIGNPLGTLGGSVTDGIISALDREITLENETMNLLQTNAAINPGNSGGGLFNGNGNLIGIVVAKSGGQNVEGLGYAIPINDVKLVVEQLINNGYVKNRATLGVYLTSLPYDYNGYRAGVYIQEVMHNSAAEKAGLRAYDRIVRFNDVEISSYDQLSKQLKQSQVGDIVTLTVIRDSKEVKVEVTLQEAINPNK